MKYKYLDNIIDYKDIKKFNDTELSIFADELRDFIISSVMLSGGHLGSSLGALELSIALCKVFNLDKDKIIWDIGHQSYAYKILTNRKENFSTLRSKGGISGFSNPLESEFDLFIGGHSSVSISNAFGLKSAMLINNDDSEVIAVIGDSAISSGVAFEALNHLGHTKEKMIVILNDNNMSISPTTGALSKYLLKIKNSTSFNFIKKSIQNTLPSFTKKFVDKIQHIDSNLFEDMGFDYYGPFEGNNLIDLLEVLEILKNKKSNNPILLHIITKKGYGYEGIENIKDCLHGVESKVAIELDNKNKISNTKIFGDYLIELAKKDESIVAITAAMSKGTGLDNFASIFQNRFFDVGIAEQHAVSFAAGLAKGGVKPYVCIYSTFMQRAYDQVIHDVALANLPVKFILDRAGLVGQDGTTHAGIYDYSMFLPIYNMVVLSPGFQEEIPLMLDFINNYNDSPIMLRFSKEKYLPNIDYSFNKIELGKAQIIYQGDDSGIAIVAIGEILQEAISVYHQIYKNFNKKITIINLRFAQPLDNELLLDIAKTHKIIFTLEEASSPSVGLNIMSLINNHNKKLLVDVKTIYIPKYIDQALIVEQKQDAKINAEYIYQRLINFIK